MKKIKVSFFVFLLSLFVLLVISFTTSFLAFGLEEEEILSYSFKQICYRVFLLFRFPAHHISLLKSIFPAIHEQLVFSSILYASTITLFISGIQFARR